MMIKRGVELLLPLLDSSSTPFSVVGLYTLTFIDVVFSLLLSLSYRNGIAKDGRWDPVNETWTLALRSLHEHIHEHAIMTR